VVDAARQDDGLEVHKTNYDDLGFFNNTGMVSETHMSNEITPALSDHFEARCSALRMKEPEKKEYEDRGWKVAVEAHYGSKTRNPDSLLQNAIFHVVDEVQGQQGPWTSFNLLLNEEKLEDHWGYKISGDIKKAVQKVKDLLEKNSDVTITRGVRVKSIQFGSTQTTVSYTKNNIGKTDDEVVQAHAVVQMQKPDDLKSIKFDPALPKEKNNQLALALNKERIIGYVAIPNWPAEVPFPTQEWLLNFSENPWVMENLMFKRNATDTFDAYDKYSKRKELVLRFHQVGVRARQTATQPREITEKEVELALTEMFPQPAAQQPIKNAVRGNLHYKKKTEDVDPFVWDYWLTPGIRNTGELCESLHSYSFHFTGRHCGRGKSMLHYERQDEKVLNCVVYGNCQGLSADKKKEYVNKDEIPECPKPGFQQNTSGKAPTSGEAPSKNSESLFDSIKDRLNSGNEFHDEIYRQAHPRGSGYPVDWNNLDQILAF
jgi:hypothetical protein